MANKQNKEVNENFLTPIKSIFLRDYLSKDISNQNSILFLSIVIIIISIIGSITTKNSSFTIAQTIIVNLFITPILIFGIGSFFHVLITGIAQIKKEYFKSILKQSTLLVSLFLGLNIINLISSFQKTQLGYSLISYLIGLFIIYFIVIYAINMKNYYKVPANTIITSWIIFALVLGVFGTITITQLLLSQLS